MATWDITVPAGSGVGGSGSGSSTITPPGDFDGATIDSVAVVGTPSLTNDSNPKDDDIGIRWRIETNAAVAVYGDYTSNVTAAMYATLLGAITTSTIADGSTPNPAPTIAVASLWDRVAYQANYSANMKNDAETVSWSAYTLRVTYTPIPPTNYQQEHYRFATPTTGLAHEVWTLVGTEDTSFEITQAQLDVNHALIIKLGNDGGIADNTLAFQLQYNVDGGGWNNVTSTSSNVRVALSGDLDQAVSSTERLTNTSRTFTVSTLDEQDGNVSIPAGNLESNEEIELYFSIVFRSADLSGGESITFRVTDTGTGTETVTYDITPTATIESTNEITSAGGIATGEALETDNSVAAATPQAISGTAGAIATGESFASDHSIAAATPQSISGTVGDIATGEAFETDHEVADVLLQITSAGAIATAEAFETDNIVALATQVIESAGAVASAEAFETDNIVVAATPQAITAAGAIASGESLPTDDAIAAATPQEISAAGAIATAEALEADNQLANVSQQITSAGAIATGESLATDAVIAIQSDNDILLAGAIASAEAFETDASLTQPAQSVAGAGAIASAEAFAADNAIAIATPQAITGAGAIASGESLPTDDIIAAATPQAILIAAGIASAEAVGSPALFGDTEESATNMRVGLSKGTIWIGI